MTGPAPKAIDVVSTVLGWVDQHREYPFRSEEWLEQQLLGLQRRADASGVTDVLSRVSEYLARFADVNDGDDGIPEPNEAMRLLSDVDALIKVPSRVSQHPDGCEWHYDQFDRDCTCGATVRNSFQPDAPSVTREALTPDAGREAIWKVVHEVWRLLDEAETDGMTGVTTPDQERWNAVSEAMDELEALVPESEGPFWGGFPVNYLWPKGADQ